MKKLLGLLMVVMVVSACNKNKVGYTVPQIDPTNTYDNRTPGASANDFLSSKKYKIINLEIVYTREHALSDTVVQATVDFLKQYCYKPLGITVKLNEVPIQGGDLGANNLSSIEKIYRTKYTANAVDTLSLGKDSVGLFIFVSDANYYLDNMLGVAYKNTSLAIFDGSISKISGAEGQPSRDAVHMAVIRHEIGHLLGLVNAGTEMQAAHQDLTHGNYCDNPDCLMHYTMERSDIAKVLMNGVVPDFDENCKNDLRANGSR